MCSAHIFKVTYMCLHTLICGAFFTDACSFPNRWFADDSPLRSSAKFQYYGIFNNAILSLKDSLLPNIIVFTLDFSISLQREIPEYWNFQWRSFLMKRDKSVILLRFIA